MDEQSFSSPDNLPHHLKPQDSLRSSPKRSSHHILHKILESASNLAKLLPTGTVLSFQALVPPLSNNGSCLLYNKYLTTSLIGVCTILCFLSSFTDSFTGKDGMLYHGIATFQGFYIFNCRDCEEDSIEEADLRKLRISLIDWVHACVSLSVFLIFAFGDANVQSCFFPKAETTGKWLSKILPLGAGLSSSFMFTVFPTRRRGIGFTDMVAKTH